MDRQIKWGRATGDYTKTRTSKCGRFKISTLHMASGRNGYFNARAYAAEFQAAPDRWIRIGRVCDTLIEALDAVEYKNDPNWEPD